MWEVIGYVESKNESGDITSYTLHLKKPIKASEGVGEKTRTAWYRPSIDYKPCLGDKILLEEEQRGKYLVIVDIIIL